MAGTATRRAGTWRAGCGPSTATRGDRRHADHIDHIRNVAVVDHVGIGADFDGIAFKVDGLEDVSRYPQLLVELARRGWRDDALAKLTGGNFLRVLEVADGARAALER